MCENKGFKKNKIIRKHNKYKDMLLKETGIECSKDPHTNLMLCNAGLVSGVSESDVVQLFSGYGHIKNVSMLIGKSYSFITFTNPSEAAVAFNSLNGLKVFKQLNGPLYLLYTKSVPEIKINHFESLPQGLHIIEDFVTEKEENELLKCIDWCNIGSNIGKTVLKHRRVKHYGYEFNYINNKIDINKPLLENIPDECSFLSSRLKSRGYKHLSPWIPDQLTVNEYHPGQGIPSHVDTHSAFESPIMSLSLGSDIIMDFKHHNGQHIPILLPQRSLLIMEGESRYDWNHGITPRKIDVIHSSEKGLTVYERNVRTSFTFRKLRVGPCDCSYPLLCDSKQQENIVSEKEASHLEQLHVHQVYENISSHFSETRHKPWPNVAEFVNNLRLGSVLVDVGCGNGKYLGLNKNIFQVGCDMSSNLCVECFERGHAVLACNCLHLPFKSNSVDGVISIAVIHHLSTEKRRIGALMEMFRILNYGGQGLVYVWAKDQQRDKQKSSYLKQDRKNRKDGANVNNISESSADGVVNNEFSLPIHKNRTQFEHEDLLVPWKLKTDKEKVFYRYYHVFQEGELEKIVSTINNVRIVKSFYDQGNWCVIFEKNIIM